MTAEPQAKPAPAGPPLPNLPWEEFFIATPIGPYTHGLVTSWAIADLSYELLVKLYMEVDQHYQTWDSMRNCVQRVILGRMEQDEVKLTPPYGMAAIRKVVPQVAKPDLPAMKEQAKAALADLEELNGEWRENAVAILTNFIDAVNGVQVSALGKPWSNFIDPTPGRPYLRMVAKLTAGPNTQPEGVTDEQRN